MMKCGHSANGTTRGGKPCCLICFGINPGAIVTDIEPDLSSRKAKCSDCGFEVISNVQLPFFRHQPHMKYDSYYCGCRGFE